MAPMGIVVASHWRVEGADPDNPDVKWDASAVKLEEVVEKFDWSLVEESTATGPWYLKSTVRKGMADTHLGVCHKVIEEAASAKVK